MADGAVVAASPLVARISGAASVSDVAADKLKPDCVGAAADAAGEGGTIDGDGTGPLAVGEIAIRSVGVVTITPGDVPEAVTVRAGTEEPKAVVVGVEAALVINA